MHLGAKLISSALETSTFSKLETNSSFSSFHVPPSRYCERKFIDERVLIMHQKARHFKCDVCFKKLSSAMGLAVHQHQMHNKQIKGYDRCCCISKISANCSTDFSDSFDLIQSTKCPLRPRQRRKGNLRHGRSYSRGNWYVRIYHAAIHPFHDIGGREESFQGPDLTTKC